MAHPANSPAVSSAFSPGCVAIRQAGTLLLVLVSGVPSPAPGQGRPPSTVYAITGVVIAEDGAPLAGAEILLSDSRLRARSGVNGQFRIRGVGQGTYEILIRAIGYAPYRRTVSVDRDQDLGTVALVASPVILPEVSTLGKVESPHLGLSFPIDMDDEKLCTGCGRNGRYFPMGASVTSDGLALTLYQPSGWRLPIVVLREHPVGIGLAGRYVFGTVDCNRRERLLATRISESGTSGGVLYQNGESWLVRLPGRCNGIRRNLLKRGDLITATGTPWGWVAVVEIEGQSYVQEFDEYGVPRWSTPLAEVFGATTDARQLIIAPFGKSVTVAKTIAPFSWAVLDSTGVIGLRSASSPAAQIDTLLGAGSFEGSRGYAVLPIRNGFVQTIETMDRKRGVFVLYNILGRPFSVQKRGPPAVLIASAFDPAVVLGYQYVHPNGTSKLLLVRY